MAKDFISLFKSQLDDPDMQGMLEGIEQTMDEWTGDILRLVIQETLAYLRSFTNRSNPPRSGYYRKFKWEKDPDYPDDRGFRGDKTKKSDRDSERRPAHPGNWSDVSGVMVAGYYGKIEKLSNGSWSGVIGNRDHDALFVEAKFGYFVVTGVFRPNGPVMQVLRKNIKKYAPGSKVLHAIALEAQVNMQNAGKTLGGTVEGVVINPP